MFCVDPSMPVIIMFIASIVDMDAFMVLDGPSGLLPANCGQRLYAPLTHLAVVDLFHDPTAGVSEEGGANIVPSIVEKISFGLVLVTDVSHDHAPVHGGAFFWQLFNWPVYGLPDWYSDYDGYPSD